MENKDAITITLSVLALILSTFSTFISLRRKKDESKNTIRDQLTDIIRDLIGVSADIHKLYYGSNASDTSYISSASPSYISAMGSILNQQIISLVRQASHLVRQIPDLANDVDYYTIAHAFGIAHDHSMANFYWKKAIENSSGEYYKAINLKGYASYLFSQGSYENGRNQYEEALRVLQGNSDYTLNTKGFIYQAWISSELSYGFIDEAKRLHRLAKILYQSISSKNLREEGIRVLEEMIKYFTQSDSQDETTP